MTNLAMSLLIVLALSAGAAAQAPPANRAPTSGTLRQNVDVFRKVEAGRHEQARSGLKDPRARSTLPELRTPWRSWFF
jgi:hypothetical protein